MGSDLRLRYLHITVVRGQHEHGAPVVPPPGSAQASNDGAHHGVELLELGEVDAAHPRDARLVVERLVRGLVVVARRAAALHRGLQRARVQLLERRPLRKCLFACYVVPVLGRLLRRVQDRRACEDVEGCRRARREG